MPAMKLDMTIPLGDAGHVFLRIDIADIPALSPDQRRVIGDTAREFCDFAARTLTDTPSLIVRADGEPIAPPPAEIHNPDKDILNGVRRA